MVDRTAFIEGGLGFKAAKPATYFISESNTLHYSTKTILDCNITTLGTNYNYIRNS